MPDTRPEVFFAYPGQSALLAETMRKSAEKLATRSGLAVSTWEDLEVDGRLVLGRILEAIDHSKVVVAEVGSINPNVLFEVGYAIAAGKQMLLCVDNTDTSAAKNWRDLALLGSIGYTSYQGSSDALVGRYLEQRPDLKTEELWEDLLVAGGVGPREPRTLFYMPVGLRGDAGKQLDRTLMARRNLSINTADEEEQGLAPLSWYAVQIYQSNAAMIHMRGPARVRASLHNARASLLAGMAAALKLPTLMVADETFEPPLDYRDMLYRYPTAKALGERVSSWLDQLPDATTARAAGRRQLAVELPVRRLGEYVAENEQDELPDYFVETGQYHAVLDSTAAVFIGRKGTGKTANMLTAAETLASDRRNLVTVIKPSGYELEGLVAILARLPEREVADYLLDGVWRFMLVTEIAAAAIREAEGRPAGIASGSPMDALRAYMEGIGFEAEANFAVRLERLLDELLRELDSLPSGVTDGQAWLNERLHSTSMHELRALMGPALKDRQRIALLIDNLDKAWERDADREQQSRMILGLLAAVGRVERDFRREVGWRERVNVTLAVFLRADIFEVVREHAREPDKIRTLQVEWGDKDLLARIIEDRYVAQRGEDAKPAELWSDFFCDEVRGRPTRDYLTWRSLPRPRDLVYLSNACILTAANHRRSRIEEVDVIAAEQDYSRFALDALMVEGSSSEELDDVLFNFAGADAVMSVSDARAAIGEVAGVDIDATFSRLLRANFLGLEVRDGVFEYPAAEASERRALRLAERMSRDLGREASVTVHPAFRPYLGIQEPSS
jgi:hypothetical protein